MNADQLKCPCCGVSNLDPKLIPTLLKLEEEIRAKVTVTSGYRCVKYNNDLRRRGFPASLKSQHLQGKAVDVMVPDGVDGTAFICAAKKVGFVGIGKPKGLKWCHLDVRSGPAVEWEY